jgi:molybdopterin synthase catalytic subunit
VRVCSRHREAAFQASRWIVDELKKKVPIWKQPKFRVADETRPGPSPPATAQVPATV